MLAKTAKNLYKSTMSKHDQEPQPDPRFGLSREELNATFSELDDSGGTLSEDFMIGEEAPTEGPTDRQIELFVPRMQKVIKREKRKRR